MSGYVWAKTPQEELFVVLVVGGMGFVPGVEGAIEMGQFDIVEPVLWPTAIILRNRNSAPPSPGALVPDATPECAILPFAASA